MDTRDLSAHPLLTRGPYAPDPADLYAWDVRYAKASRSEGGVSDDESVAVAKMHDALRGADEGARGEVRRVALHGTRIAYIDLEIVAQATRTGSGVSWIR